MSQLDDDIDSLLARYDPPLKTLARQVLALVRELRPDFSARVGVAVRCLLQRQSQSQSHNPELDLPDSGMSISNLRRKYRGNKSQTRDP